MTEILKAKLSGFLALLGMIGANLLPVLLKVLLELDAGRNLTNQRTVDFAI